MTRPTLLAVVSDVHAGSTLAVCPPQITLDDGGTYNASQHANYVSEPERPSAGEITQNELTEALIRAHAAPTEARTVTELVALTGWSDKRVRDAIGKLAMQDRIVVHHVQRTAISGAARRVPAYTITPKKRK